MYIGTQSFENKSFISVLNSSANTLAAGATFTGTGENVSNFPSVLTSVKTDQDGTLYMEFSTDNSNWDSSLSFTVVAGTNEVHRLVASKKYFRARFTNTSASNQTYFRLQTMCGNANQLTSALNFQIQKDSDAIAVRPLDFNLLVAQNLFEGHQNTIKDGINADISSGTVPEDVWQTGGAYTGFPTAAVENGEIIVAGADTGTVYYSYLLSPTSTDYVIGSKAITGAGTYSLGHNIWRCNFAYFVSSSATAFNVGLITIRNTTTTTNIFCEILAGYSQSYCAAYTVPYGSSIYLDRLQGTLRGNTNATLDGFIWYRAYGESPRLRFPFTLQFGSLYFDDVDYLVRIPQQTDLVPRITSASTNNLLCQFTYRLIKVKG